MSDIERESLHPYWLQFLERDSIVLPEVPKRTVADKLADLVNLMCEGVKKPAPRG